jgi:cell division protein FtsQ
MDRSFAGRLGIGSLSPPRARTKARPGRARSRRAGAGARAAPRGRPGAIDIAIERLLRAPVSLAGALAAGWRFLRAHRRARFWLLVALLSLALLGGGWLWLRHSSLVSVQHVRVSGVHGTDAGAIEAALTSAAKRMSTLDVSTARLRAAVAGYPVVAGLHVHARFPHGLGIEVIEQPAVAALATGGAKTAVAANGVVLGTEHVSGSLPTVTGPVQLTPGERVREAALRGELAVLGAAPASLARTTERAYAGSKGLTLLMRSGLRVYFGDASRPRAKWASLARVLADPGSAGASYADVRVPERPAAGFPAGVAPPVVEGSEGSSTAGVESAESIAEKLSAAVPSSGSEAQAGVSTEPSSGEAEASHEAEASAEPSGSTGEATSAQPSGE